MKKAKKDRLRYWQERAAASETAYQKQLDRMDERERMYLGTREIKPMNAGKPGKSMQTPHIRNIAAELIEAQVDSNLPQPKVTPKRKEDEHLAEIIEGMIRDEMDRLPFEMINDQAGRTVPIQGGSLYLIEWDNSKGSQTQVGEIALSGLHPKQVIPQDGVYSDIEDMDYIFLKLPQTKDYIERRYGVCVDDEGEAEPDVRGVDEATAANDMVTQYIAYYRNDSGGIGLYSWVNDTELEDLEDYQARRLRHCAKCGEKEPPEGTMRAAAPTMDGSYDPEAEAEPVEDGSCPYCGANEWEYGEEEFEEIWDPIERNDGKVIPGRMPVSIEHPAEVDEMGGMIEAWMEVQEQPTKVPYYKPDIFPVVLQKNVSVFGRFLGDSDIDKIADQQYTTNRIEKKILDKLTQGGSYITLPTDALIKTDGEDMRVIRPKNQADKAMIDVYNLQAEINQDMAYLQQVYEEARQEIGITDSFQGRKDTTATSGKAKEFSAAQTAGRMESKRVMREAAYARIFEAMFKFQLAYADEPRQVALHNENGDVMFEEFNRYDFLEQDDAGNWYWNDQFLFSCDTSAPLASNREAMWQETRMNLQTGAFGDPTKPETLILFWSRMEQLHYTGAGQTKKALEDQLEQQKRMQERMAQIQMQAQLAQQQTQRDMAAMVPPTQATPAQGAVANMR